MGKKVYKSKTRMKPLKELLSPEEYNDFKEYMKKLESGKVKPDSEPGDGLDTKLALENFKKVQASGLTEKHMKKMKARFSRW